ncbi:MAG TPA: futalosine hydrolase [Chitinophagaceae bacterium]|nr:futalosine hydrolase [Chitinophagaceae bacterium]
MNCLIVAATAKEIGPFLEDYRDPESLLPMDMSIDVLITGVGLTAASYHISKQLQLKKPGLVIQVGIAGSFDRKLPLASVVAIKQEQVADLGVSASKGFLSVFDLGLTKKNQYPYKNGWLINATVPAIKASGLKAVKGISVNQVSTSPSMINSYKKRFRPVIESMEGAALHYVCLMERVPFIQLRSVSNYIGERNKKKWALKESIDTLNKALIHLITNL